MTDDPKCPACERWGFSAWERSCTGRPGCAQKEGLAALVVEWINRTHDAGNAVELEDCLEAERAALALRVAEAVREECRYRIYSATYISEALDILNALDLAPIVAAAIKKETT